jgi:hypothetical protein
MDDVYEDVAARSRGSSRWDRIAPALALLLLAPLVAEVLPGATRFSAIFVLPIEICVWGGAALLIRETVRRKRLGWRNMLLLALALAVAEECLIQQTSLAPLVIQLKGQTYARALGVNYVYLLWALVYESVFVVFVPISLTELIFERRRRDLWLGRVATVFVVIFFALGGFLAWFSWTQIARPNVFHVPAYNPPVSFVAVAVAVVACLVFCSVGPPARRLARPSRPLTPPRPWSIGMAASLWAMLWYALVLLAFGIAPQFPPGLAVGAGIALATAVLCLLPRWTAHRDWCDMHQFATIFGAMLGSMLVSFVGFIGSLPLDLYFKFGVDAIAILLLAALGIRVRRQSTSEFRRTVSHEF